MRWATVVHFYVNRLGSVDGALRVPTSEDRMPLKAQVRVRIGVLDGGEAGLGSRLSCPHKQICQQVRITVLLHKANKKGPAEVGKWKQGLGCC